MIGGAKRLGLAIVLFVLGAPGLARALAGPPGSGPEYVEYQAPIRLQGDVLAGGLACLVAVLLGVLLMLSKRPLAGAMLGAAGLALGVFLMVCHIELR